MIAISITLTVCVAIWSLWQLEEWLHRTSVVRSQQRAARYARHPSTCHMYETKPYMFTCPGCERQTLHATADEAIAEYERHILESVDWETR